MTFPVYFANKKKNIKQAVNAFLPGIVIVPLVQESGTVCRCLVHKGDAVQEGQIIAEPAEENEKLQAKIHSPVPGIIEDTILCTCPDGKKNSAVQIRMKGAFKYLGKTEKISDWKQFLAASIIQNIADQGVVNTFLASKTVSFASQLSKAASSVKKHLLIVRLFDEDPARITDTVLSRIFKNDIYTGALITARAFHASGIVFINDEGELTDDFNMQERDKDAIPIRCISVNSENYPVGLKKEIQENIKKNLKEKPFSEVSSEDIFTDSSTMLDVCRVIKYGIPVISKYVHVNGNCLPASGLMNVRIGTTLRFLAEQCGGFIAPPAAIIINGIISGRAVESLDTPITKYVKSVSFLPSGEVPDQRQSSCIRCGNCRKVCPCHLTPDVLYRHAAGGKSADKDYIISARLCSECGLCNSVCPARLPISQTVSFLKNAEFVQELPVQQNDF